MAPDAQITDAPNQKKQRPPKLIFGAPQKNNFVPFPFHARAHAHAHARMHTCANKESPNRESTESPLATAHAIRQHVI